MWEAPSDILRKAQGGMCSLLQDRQPRNSHDKCQVQPNSHMCNTFHCPYETSWLIRSFINTALADASICALNHLHPFTNSPPLTESIYSSHSTRNLDTAIVYHCRSTSHYFLTLDLAIIAELGHDSNCGLIRSIRPVHRSTLSAFAHLSYLMAPRNVEHVVAMKHSLVDFDN